MVRIYCLPESQVGLGTPKKSLWFHVYALYAFRVTKNETIVHATPEFPVQVWYRVSYTDPEMRLASIQVAT